MLTSGSSQGGLLEIGISLVMQDRFSQPAREASSELRKLHQEAKMAVEANLQMAKEIGANLMTGSANIYKLYSGFIQDGVEYIDTMTTVKAITQSTEDQFASLGKTAKKLGVDTMFSAKEIAGGMRYLAMAGMKAKEIQDVIGGATYLAGATGMRIEGKGGAADLMTNVAKAFRISGTEGANMVADLLTKATLSANVSVSDLAESIKYASASMVSFKRTLPETLAMLGTLGNAGIQGSMAGVALQNMVIYLGKAITQTESAGHKWLNQLGLTRDQLVDANGDLLPMVQILYKFRDALKDAGGSINQSAVLKDVFSVRGMRGAQALLGDLEGFQKLWNEIQYGSMGTSEDIMAKRMDSLAGRLDQLRESITTFGISFSETVAPVLTRVFSTLTHIITRIQGFMDSTFGKLVTNVLLIAPAVTWVAGKVLTWISTIRLAHNDTLITGNNMLRALFTNWTSLHTPALQYANLLKYIQMLQTGVGTGMMGLSSSSAKKKAAVLSSLIGEKIYYDKYIGQIKPNGNLFLYEKVPGRNLPKSLGYANKNATNAAIGQQLMARSSIGTVASATAGTAAKKGLFRYGVGSGLRFLGGKLISGLMGPWGLGIMTISTLLPPIIELMKERISSERENTSSSDKNTASVYTLAGKYDKESERLSAGKDLTLTQEQIALLNSIKYWTQMMENIFNSQNNKPVANLVINIDGKKTIEQIIENQDNQININNGLQTS